MKSKIIWIIILAVVAGFIGGYFFPKSNKLTDESIQAEPAFIMSDNLACEIKNSSSQEEIGRQISLINLNSDEPKVLFNDTGSTSPLNTIYKSDDTVVVQLVAAASGSVDTFVVDKKTGLFSRAAAGSFLGVYSTASKGSCK